MSGLKFFVFLPDCLWASPLHCTLCHLLCHHSSPIHTWRLSSGSHGHRSPHTEKERKKKKITHMHTHGRTQKERSPVNRKLSQTLSKCVKVDILEGASVKVQLSRAQVRPWHAHTQTHTCTPIHTHSQASTLYPILSSHTRRSDHI